MLKQSNNKANMIIIIDASSWSYSDWNTLCLDIRNPPVHAVFVTNAKLSSSF